MTKPKADTARATPPDSTDMEALRQRHVEAGQERQRAADMRLRRALVLGSKLAEREG